MRITIDTKQDTQDEIRKVIEILSAITQSGNAPSGNEPKPVTGEGIFGMFSDSRENSGLESATSGSKVVDSKGPSMEAMITGSGKEDATESRVINAVKETPVDPYSETGEVKVVLNERGAGEEKGEVKVAVSESREQEASSLSGSGEVSGIQSENKVESVHTPEPKVVDSVTRDNDTKIIPY